MKKSKFNLTHLNSLTLDPGYLVPFFLMPTLPNDSFKISLATFIRAQPMLAPLMHEVRLFTQYWYVPNRLVWSRWEEFITGGDNLDSSPNFPVVVSGDKDVLTGSLWDYFGFPMEKGVEVSALPFRALSLIYNTRYRDEDLQEEIPLSLNDGLDAITSRDLLSPSISKDYFSLARPFTQRGADVFIPVTTGESSTQIYHSHKYRYRIVSLVTDNNHLTAQNPTMYADSSIVYSGIGNVPGATVVYANSPENFVSIVKRVYSVSKFESSLNEAVKTVLTPTVFVEILKSTPPGRTFSQYYELPDFTVRMPIVPNTSALTDFVFKKIKVLVEVSIETDTTLSSPGNVPVIPEVTTLRNGNSYSASLSSFGGSYSGWYNSITYPITLSSTGAISVRDIRASSALQRYAERSLKFGNRYEEFIQREFGIKPRDSRIQRPEYIGGGSGILNISEVLQTAESTDTGVGTMRGHGIASISQRNIRFRSPEHGLIIGLLSIRPKSVYTQGIDREFLKRSRIDFYTPELSNIGMQEVLTQELYATGANKGQVFGYSDRYQEYRYKKPLVCGEFRGNLDFWNMAFKYANQPELTGEFLNMSTYIDDYKRPFQIQDNGAHAFVCMLKNVVKAYRPISKISKDILR